MKRLFSFTFAIGAILVLIAALLKELKLKGEKQVFVAAICILLLAMVFYLVSIIKDKEPQGESSNNK